MNNNPGHVDRQRCIDKLKKKRTRNMQNITHGFFDPEPDSALCRRRPLDDVAAQLAKRLSAPRQSVRETSVLH